MDSLQVVSIAGGAGVSFLMLFLGVLSMAQRRNRATERLRTYVQPDANGTAESGPLADVLSGIDRWAGKRSFGASIARMLAQADVKMTVAEYMLLHLGLFAAGLVLGPALLRSAPAGVVLAVLLFLAPNVFVSSAQQKRQHAFAEQLPIALNSVSNSMRSGYGLVQAMQLVSTEMPEPMAMEFKRVVSEVSYGLPYDVAFANMLRRNPSPDLSMVVTAIEINLEVGGNLSEILDGISSIIRDRVRIQGQVRALTAQVRFSSMVLTLLPFGVAGVILIVNPEYISLLWTTTAGIIMLVAALCLIVVGSLILRRIARIDV